MEHSDNETINRILDLIEYVALGIEILAVSVIVFGIVWATYYFLTSQNLRHAIDRDVRYRHRLGRTLLIGLEILVAADIVRTVALDPTLESVAVLGMLVVIRTFLSWALVIEMERRWPWQRPDEPERGERVGEPGSEPSI